MDPLCVFLPVGIEPQSIDPDVISALDIRGQGISNHQHVFHIPAACVSVGMKGQELTDMDALKAAGAVGFTDDGIPLMDQKLVRQAMLKAKELDVPLSFHEEDPAFISENGIHAGEAAKALGIHERFIVPNEKFQAKADKKAQK